MIEMNKHAVVYLKNGSKLDFDKKCNRVDCSGDGVFMFKRMFDDHSEHLAAIPTSNITYIEWVHNKDNDIVQKCNAELDAQILLSKSEEALEVFDDVITIYEDAGEDWPRCIKVLAQFYGEDAKIVRDIITKHMRE